MSKQITNNKFQRVSLRYFSPLILLPLLVLIGGGVVAGKILWGPMKFDASKATSQISREQPLTLSREENKEEKPQILAEVVAEGLEVPWSIAFLPNGDALVTERPGRVRLITKDGELGPQSLYEFKEVSTVSESGLHGVAVHPSYNDNHWVYFYLTYRDGSLVRNKVERFIFDSSTRTLTFNKLILELIPAARFHDGGRLKFGPDGKLYVTTGDATNPSLAQDSTSLAGKVLRLNDDGSVPEDNPTSGSPVYSLGHRNPQGLAWNTAGKLYETEHGDSATDEVNIIEAGENYGWPLIRGNDVEPGLSSPWLQSGEETTWAPSGMAYSETTNSLFFAGLRGQSLYKVDLSVPTPVVQQYFVKEFGRLRDVVVGPDNLLYVLTSNRDGRGVPSKKDDRIIRVNPKLFSQ